MRVSPSTERPSSVKTMLAQTSVSRLTKIAEIVGLAALLFVIAGMIVRVTIRDQYLVSGLIYYVASPSSMVLLSLFSAVCMRATWRKSRRLAFGLVLLAMLWLVATQWVSHDSLPPQANQPETQRLMFWNVCEGKLGWSRVLATIKEQDPDVIALAKADTLKVHGDDFFDTHFPGYQRISLPRRLVLLSRLPILKQRQLRWMKGAVHESVVLKSQQGPVTLIFSDVVSTLSLHRKLPIEALVEVATKLKEPVLVVGDLNTSVDSVFFDKFRVSFKNAFESAGNGLHTTWPMPLPVIAIDHMWGNEDVTFSNAKILWTLASDHRPLVAEFSVLQASE